MTPAARRNPLPESSVAVVIPTYNEAGNIEALVARIFEETEGASIRVWIVDDNSPDGTGEVADELSRRYGIERVVAVHRKRKAGMGQAYVEGFQKALAEGAELVVQMDADFAHDPEYLPELIRRASGPEAGVVVASRYCPGGDLSGLSLPRRLLSRLANAYARFLLGLSVLDVTGGFKCYRREVLESMDLARIRSTGFAFQVEILYKCSLRGVRFVETPIVFRDRHAGRSKMSLGIILEGLVLVPRMKRLARQELRDSRVPEEDPR